MSNQAMPHLVKIGYSSRLPEDRAKELHTTAVPYGFDVAFRAVTSRPIEVERKVHELLAAHRAATNREFFRVPPDVAIDAVRQAALEMTGINSWAQKPIHHLRSGDRVALTLRSTQMFVLMALSDLLASEMEIVDFR